MRTKYIFYIQVKLLSTAEGKRATKLYRTFNHEHGTFSANYQVAFGFLFNFLLVAIKMDLEGIKVKEALLY